MRLEQIHRDTTPDLTHLEDKALDAKYNLRLLLNKLPSPPKNKRNTQFKLIIDHLVLPIH